MPKRVKKKQRCNPSSATTPAWHALLELPTWKCSFCLDGVDSFTGLDDLPYQWERCRHEFHAVCLWKYAQHNLFPAYDHTEKKLTCDEFAMCPVCRENPLGIEEMLDFRAVPQQLYHERLALKQALDKLQGVEVKAGQASIRYAEDFALFLEFTQKGIPCPECKEMVPFQNDDAKFFAEHEAKCLLLQGQCAVHSIVNSLHPYSRRKRLGVSMDEELRQMKKMVDDWIGRHPISILEQNDSDDGEE